MSVLGGSDPVMAPHRLLTWYWRLWYSAVVGWVLPEALQFHDSFSLTMANRIAVIGHCFLHMCMYACMYTLTYTASMDWQEKGDTLNTCKPMPPPPPPKSIAYPTSSIGMMSMSRAVASSSSRVMPFSKLLAPSSLSLLCTCMWKERLWEVLKPAPQTLQACSRLSPLCVCWWRRKLELSVKLPLQVSHLWTMQVGHMAGRI